MRFLTGSHLRAAMLSTTLVLGVSLAPAVAQDNTDVTIPLEVDAATLDPRLQRDTTAFRLTDIIYSGLVTFDADFLPQPDLAKSWEQPDPKTVVFHLREDAVFHDGTPVTAEDVVFTFTSIKDPELKSRYAQFFAPVESIVAVDTHTVQFNLSEPYAPLFSYLDLGIVSKAYAESGADTGNAPMGSGPYKIEKWEKGVTIDLAAFDKYYGGEAYVKKIHSPIVTDYAARAQALEAGDADIVMSNLNPQDVIRLEGNPDFAHSAMPSMTFNYLNFNTADPILKDPAVRRAVAKLIDAKTINDAILGGIDTLANSIILPGFKWVDTSDVQQFAFDIEAAKAELDALGWKVGPDGVRVKDGQRLTIKLSTNSGIRGQIVEYLQNVFQQAGIEAKTAIADYATFIAGVYDGSYGIAMISMNNIADPDRAIYLQLHSGAPLNWGKYSNPELDAAAEAGRSAATVEERAAAYKKAAQIIAEDVPYYILTYVRQDNFANKDFSWFEGDARGNLRSLVRGPKK